MEKYGVVNYLLHSSCTWEMEETLLSLSSYSSEICSQRCNYCTNTYACTEEYLIHMKDCEKKSHFQLTKRNICKKCYKCEVCNKEFTYKSYLKRHINVHTSEKPYKCNHCDKEFTHKSTLTNHNRVHSGAKPFKCNQSEKEFTKKSKLTSHIRVHTGENP